MTATLTAAPVADDATRDWREEQFSKLGFADAPALALDTSVDLGLARRLVASGCDPATARRIL